jgi:AraC-like DNA-binding protein
MAGRKPNPPGKHGTRARYMRGCRCGPCSGAHYRYLVSRQRSVMRGTWEPFADAAPVREHVAALTAAGLTEANVASEAGVSRGQMEHLMHGSNGSAPGRRIRHDAAARILAVRPLAAVTPGAGEIDATGTRRRIRALVACGWPQGWLAAQLGVKPPNISAMLRGARGQARVRATTAAAVRELYARLWDVPPPQSTPRERAICARARAMAAERGWAPPAGWDEGVIDDPAGRPADGWQRPARTRWRTADLAEEAGELLRFAHGPDEEHVREHIAERLGVTKVALDAALARARRTGQREVA